MMVAPCGTTVASHAGWTTNDRGDVYCAACGEVPIYREDRAFVFRLLGMGHKAYTPTAIPRAAVDKKRGRRAVNDATASNRAANRAVKTNAARAAFLHEWYRDWGPVCFYCGRTMRYPADQDVTDGQRDILIRAGDWPTFDHLIPVAMGGRTIWSNMVIACGPCNQTKGDDVGHVVVAVQRLWRRIADRDDELRRAQYLIEALKAEMVALGADVEPVYSKHPEYADRVRPTATIGFGVRHCSNCGTQLLPFVSHTCHISADHELLIRELGFRAVSGMRGENTGDLRRRVAHVRDRARGALLRAAKRAETAA